MFKYLFLILLILHSNPLMAETVTVKYRDTPVDVSNGYFEELSIKPSSFINRLIYDKKNSYVLVQLRRTFYHYCGIPEPKVESWVAAESLGGFYNSNIKGNYDCRINPVPSY